MSFVAYLAKLAPHFNCRLIRQAWDVMTKRLSAKDGQAADLMLDRSNMPSQSRSTYAAPSDQDMRERVAKVEKVLDLLQAWPVEEPPTDLVQRTLSRVAGAHENLAIRPSAEPGRPGTHTLL